MSVEAVPISVETTQFNRGHLRDRLGRLAATGLAVAAGVFSAFAVKETVDPETASAEILGYPHYNMPCEHAPYNVEGPCANYDWGPKHTEVYDDPSQYSSRGYTYRNCTDYTAWKLQSLGVADSATRGLGNGGQWYNNAPIAKRSSIPQPWGAAVSPGTIGHVAFVESVNSVDTANPLNSNITVTEYNHEGLGIGGTRTGTAAALGFTKFVDFGIRPAGSGNPNSPYAEGTFLHTTDTQRVYRIVGGAPVRQYNWGVLADFRGQATDVNQGQINALPAYPADKAFVNLQEAGGNGIYRFVGGAPIRQYNWGILKGFDSSKVVNINAASVTNLDHMRPVPADGKFVNLHEAGGNGIYRFIGGAPIRQYNWGILNGYDSNKVVDINAASVTNLDHMNAVPRSGVFVNLHEAGGNGIYEFVGGAPVRLFNWGIIPGFGNAHDINAESVTQLDHMNAVPSNGEFIAAAETGTVFRFAGGAALKLYNQGAIPGYNGATYVNQQSIDIADHMNKTPANGTVLKGVTSQTYWEIQNGKRTQVGAKNSAVIVDEQTITDIPAS